MHKCEFPNGLVIKPDGIHELSACCYQEVERYANDTVSIRKCQLCGNIDIAWFKQEDTEIVEIE